MKTPEDEAFDDLAKRQGAWGGGFKAKQAMAADKLQEPWNEDEWRRNNWRCQHGWLRGEQCEICNAAQPAQEPVGTLNISRYKGHLVNHDFDYFGELPDGTYSVYTAPPQREWVGLTQKEVQEIHDTYHKRMGLQEFASMLEAKLKEKNNG